MDLVRPAASGHEAVRRAAELQPHIVVMDIHSPTWKAFGPSGWCPVALRSAIIIVASEERLDFLCSMLIVSESPTGVVLE